MASERFSLWRGELFRTGAIDPLRLGVSQNEVAAAFGPPDDVSNELKKGRPLIFKYADIEFHFDHRFGHRLFLIYSEGDGREPRISVR